MQLWKRMGAVIGAFVLITMLGCSFGVDFHDLTRCTTDSCPDESSADGAAPRADGAEDGGRR